MVPVSNFGNHAFHKVLLNIHLLNYSHFWGQRCCTYCTYESYNLSLDFMFVKSSKYLTVMIFKVWIEIFSISSLLIIIENIILLKRNTGVTQKRQSIRKKTSRWFAEYIIAKKQQEVTYSVDKRAEQKQIW